jgi:hypothetical protein
MKGQAFPDAGPHWERVARKQGTGDRCRPFFLVLDVEPDFTFEHSLDLDLKGLTFELSGALPTAQPAVRCPLERGVGRQRGFSALTFQLRHLLPLD